MNLEQSAQDQKLIGTLKDSNILKEVTNEILLILTQKPDFRLLTDSKPLADEIQKNHRQNIWIESFYKNDKIPNFELWWVFTNNANPKGLYKFGKRENSTQIMEQKFIIEKEKFDRFKKFSLENKSNKRIKARHDSLM